MPQQCGRSEEALATVYQKHRSPLSRKTMYLLDQVTTEGKLLPELIGEGALQHLAVEDRARAQRLATETLRGMARADRMLARFLQKTPPDSLRNCSPLCA